MRQALLLVLGLLAGTAIADTVTITGNYPTQNTNDSAIPATGEGSLTTGRIEYGTCLAGNAFGTKVGEVTRPVAGAPGAAFSHSLNLNPGTSCIRMMVTNTYGNESAPSNVTTRTVATPTPKPPTLATTGTAAVIPVWNSRYGYWAMGDQVGTVRKGAACNPKVSYGNGYYEPADRKDVALYFGRREPAMLAVQCGGA